MTKQYTAIVGFVARNESTYIVECVLHNLIVGFERIVVGLHDCTDDTREKLEKLQGVFPDKIDFFDVTKTNNVRYGVEHAWWQYECYHEIYHRYRDKAGWLGFFDVDECFWHRGGKSVTEVLTALSPTVGQVILFWLNFGGSNRMFSVPDDSTRYQWFNCYVKPVREQQAQIKPIVRLSSISPEINTADWYGIHRCYLKPEYTSIFCTGQEVQRIGIVTQPNATVDKHDMVLTHYMTGSMEDYVRRAKLRTWRQSQDVHYFFAHNTPYQDSRMMIYHEEMLRLKEMVLSK